MISEGRLVDTDVPTLVRSLYEAGWTGLLTVTSAGIGKCVTVQDGRMVFASSSSSDDRLGEQLLCRGRITLRQFLDGSKAMRPGKRLGTLLVEAGALTPKELVRGVVEQTEEIIYSLFLLTEGQYRLQEGPPSPEAIKLNLSTPDLIMEGIRRIGTWSRIDRAVGGPEARYERGKDSGRVMSQMVLNPEARTILETLEGPRSVAEMCAASPLSDVETCRAIWAFRVIGILLPLDVPVRLTTAGEADDDGLGAIFGSTD